MSTENIIRDLLDGNISDAKSETENLLYAKVDEILNDVTDGVSASVYGIHEKKKKKKDDDEEETKYAKDSDSENEDEEEIDEYAEEQPTSAADARRPGIGSQIKYRKSKKAKA